MTSACAHWSDGVVTEPQDILLGAVMSKTSSVAINTNARILRSVNI